MTKENGAETHGLLPIFTHRHGGDPAPHGDSHG